ncbi:MAG: tetratricopeptide repeat protein [Anaerolineales bacterium]|nr:MAG: tetratricopeptide repeat protein [Anaerolineales bacterium]
MFSKSNPSQIFADGRKLLDNGNHDEAIKAFTKVIDLAPTSYEAYTNRGLAYVNKFFSIVDSIKEEQRKGVAQKYFSEGVKNFDKAIEILKLVIKKHEGEKELLAKVFIFRAEANYFLENLNEVFSDLSHALQYDSSNPDIYLKRGTLYLDDLDDPELAIEDFSKGIRIQPSAKAYISRCWAYIENGDAEEAVKDYKRAKTLDVTFVKNSERNRSIFKSRQWEQFKKEADNLSF